MKCPMCNGSGKYLTMLEEHICPKCGGKGEIDEIMESFMSRMLKKDKDMEKLKEECWRKWQKESH